MPEILTDSYLPPRALPLGPAYVSDATLGYVFGPNGLQQPVPGSGSPSFALLAESLSGDQSCKVVIPIFNSSISNFSVGLVLRYKGVPQDDPGNSFYELVLSASIPNLFIAKLDGSGSAFLAQINSLPPIPANSILEFSITGNLLRAKLNGAQLLSCTDKSLTGGTTGFITTGPSLASFFSEQQNPPFNPTSGAASTPLTPPQIEALFQGLTLSMGLALTQTDPGNKYSSVRIGWQTQGQPSNSVDENVIYVRCVEDDDEYNRTRDMKIISNRNTVRDNDAKQDVTYVRVWRCYWTIYGPASFDNGRLIKSALLTDQSTHDVLANAKLSVVTNMQSPNRLPEPFPGELWIERVDFSCQFNELVRETAPINTVISTEVIIEDQLGYQVTESIAVKRLPNNTYGAGPYGSD